MRITSLFRKTAKEFRGFLLSEARFIHQVRGVIQQLHGRIGVRRFIPMRDFVIDASNVPVLTKLEVAEHQLKRALRLYLDGDDHISAITLAGASEEILGKLLEERGRQHALGSLVDACIGMGMHLYQEKWGTKEFVSLTNYFRDGLKHNADGEPISIPREAAAEILGRAVDNYWSLTGKEAALMRRFMETCYGV